MRKKDVDHLNDLLEQAKQAWVDDRWGDSLSLIGKARELATEHRADARLQTTLTELHMRVISDEYDAYIKDGGLLH
jgi:hypothetical protein